MAEQPAKGSKTVVPALEDAHEMGREMVNRSPQKMGAIETEERRFGDLFGVGATIALATFPG